MMQCANPRCGNQFEVRKHNQIYCRKACATQVWQRAHPEYARKVHKAYEQAHLASIRARQQRWRKANPELVKEYAAKGRKNRRQERAEYNQRWAAANPERHKEIRDRSHQKRLASVAAMRELLKLATEQGLFHG